MKKHLHIFLMLTAMTPMAARSQKLIFDPPRGFYETAFDLTITSPVEGSVIKYTFNGEDPRTSSSTKSAASPATLRIDPGSTAGRDKAPGVCVRAIALAGGQAVTNLSTHTYLFASLITQLSPDNARPGPKWPAPDSPVNGQEINYGMDPDVYNHSRYKNKILQAMLAVPSFSMVIDLDSLFSSAEGIYVNAAQHGEEWERACSLELIHPDGSDGFHINCGVRIRGGYSRVPWNPKHAFRFFFRSRYGEAKLRHPLFEKEGVDEFDKIDMACPQNYSWSYGNDDPAQNTFLRDQFSRDLQRDMGQPYTRSRYYHLYINGTYWGLFYTQERSEADYAASYFSGAPEDFDVIKVDAGLGRPYIIEAANGNLDAYNGLWQIAGQGFGGNDAYTRVQGLNSDGTVNPAFTKLVDLDNLIDYMINTFWVGDFDAPISNFLGNNSPNNFFALYNRVSPDGFKYFRHDAEHIMNVGWGVDIDRTGPYPAGTYQEHFNPQWLHQNLCDHPEYRLRFADRVYRHLFNGGALTEEANTARVNARREQIDLAIIAESARWGDSKSWDPYTRDAHWVPAVDWILDTWIPQRNEILLGQFRNKGWYPAVEPPAFGTRSGTVEKGFSLVMRAPAGKIYYTLDGVDPHNPHGQGGFRQVSLVDASAAKRVRVPSGAISPIWRSGASFDDSAWLACTGAPGGVGYEKDSGYEGSITLDVAEYMHQDDTAQPNASCLVRIPFDVRAEDIPKFSELKLSVLFDDGFAAYLNGTQVAAFNAPADPQWNSTATENHEAAQAEIFDITSHLGRLRAGRNLLALHALNVSLSSSDFIILAELNGGMADGGGDLLSASAVEYTGPVIVNRTTHFKARVLQGGQWSPLDEITLAVHEDLSALRITEIHYHPLPLAAGSDTVDGDLMEFLELKNVGGTALNLTGAAFVRGVHVVFPAGMSLDPGGFLVLCSSAGHFRQRYGMDADGQYTGNLSNGGERVALVSAAGDTVFSIRYDDEDPWPWEPDSTGHSLVPYHYNAGGNPGDASYWKPSAQVHGSPYADDFASPVPEKAEPRPAVFKLHPNHPNPFNPSTAFEFELPRASHVTLAVYNALGVRVAVLMDRFMQPGKHSAAWDASSFAGGLYLARLQSSDGHSTVKVLLLK